MKDVIVDEIHQIRKRTYEETKNMSPEELISYFHNSSKEIREQIAQRRVQKKKVEENANSKDLSTR